MFDVLRENVHMEGRVVLLFQDHDVAPDQSSRDNVLSLGHRVKPRSEEEARGHTGMFYSGMRYRGGRFKKGARVKRGARPSNQSTTQRLTK